jgi:hypothetical protein
LSFALLMGLIAGATQAQETGAGFWQK